MSRNLDEGMTTMRTGEAGDALAYILFLVLVAAGAVVAVAGIVKLGSMVF